MNDLISSLPHFCAFAAIGTDVNILPAFQDLFPESTVFPVLPDFFKGFFFQVA
jgi:hypothetical protein